MFVGKWCGLREKGCKGKWFFYNFFINFYFIFNSINVLIFDIDIIILRVHYKSFQIFMQLSMLLFRYNFETHASRFKCCFNFVAKLYLFYLQETRTWIVLVTKDMNSFGDYIRNQWHSLYKLLLILETFGQINTHWSEILLFSVCIVTTHVPINRSWKLQNVQNYCTRMIYNSSIKTRAPRCHSTRSSDSLPIYYHYRQ